MLNSTSQYKFLTLNRDSSRGVDVLTLNRPQQLNSLSPGMVTELLDYFGELNSAEYVRQQYVPRVVVLKGSGRAFCAGLDLFAEDTSGLEGETDAKNLFATQRRISEIIVRMRRCKQPIISLIQGAACGGGLALALASDVRFCTKDAKFNVAMVKIGLSGCDVGISYLLPRMVGPSLAASMMMTGNFLYAQKASEIGFVSSVHDDYSSMETAADALVNDMLATSYLGLSLTKEGLNASLSASSLEAQIALEDRQQILCALDSDFKKILIKTLTSIKGKPKANM